ncbi:MAG: hypothetical protein AAGG51_25710 [Cyanobacteria bacterium P01_G01_bin.54]
MTVTDYDKLDLDELRRYVLKHREDIKAFEAYIDRSKSSGRMITIDPSDPDWEDHLAQKLRQVD